MILTLTGQFKQLSNEPEKFRLLNGFKLQPITPCYKGYKGYTTKVA